MKKIFTISIALSIWMAAPLGVAKIYRWTDSSGHINFSDKPHKGARQVKLKPVQTFNHTKIANLSDVSDLIYGKKKKDKKSGDSHSYNSVSIAQPKDDEAVRANNGNVTFVVTVDPSLNEQHLIGIYIDGQLSTKSSSTSITVANIDRGTHEAVAKVLSSDGSEIESSSPIKFHVIRHFVSNKKLDKATMGKLIQQAKPNINSKMIPDLKKKLNVKAFIENVMNQKG